MNDLGASRRWGILAICCLALLVVGLDNTIVNVALPAIGRAMSVRASALEWVVDAYTLVLASLLMISGSLADRYGRKRLFLLGLVIFSAGSLLCGLAPSAGTLVAFRAIQAVGGSMLNPVAVSIIANTFTDQRERAQAMGVWAAVFGLGIALGPVAGGALVSALTWRLIFWVNVPVGAAAVILTARYVPESRAERPRRPDWPGQALVMTLFATLTFAIIEGPDAGWASPRILAAFGAAALSMAALLACESRGREPLVDLRLFRGAPFSGAVVVAVCAYVSLGGLLFINTLYLQEARGFSALGAGVRTLPMAVMAMTGAVASGAIVAARGARLPLVAGGIGICASAVILMDLTETTSYGWLLAAYLAFGTGFGMLNAPITNTAVAGLPPSQAGLAGGIAATSRQLGQSLGVAVAGALTATAAGTGQAGAGFAASTHPAWWVMLACGAVIAIVGYAATRRTASGPGSAVVEDRAGQATGDRGGR